MAQLHRVQHHLKGHILLAPREEKEKEKEKGRAPSHLHKKVMPRVEAAQP